jgi:hypothetical protein
VLLIPHREGQFRFEGGPPETLMTYFLAKWEKFLYVYRCTRIGQTEMLSELAPAVRFSKRVARVWIKFSGE